MRSAVMDHLMPIHPRDSVNNTFSQTNEYTVGDPTRDPLFKDVYVGHIPSEVDSAHLHSFFSQFGEIERIFEGRRIPAGRMKWAFVSYVHPEDAAKVLQQAGRIGLAGSMLNIRPRDKTAATEREREQRERERRSLHPIQRERPLANQMVNLSRNAAFPCASTRGFPPRSPESSVNRPWNPYPLLSKTLTVANIPPDFTPKDLYELFGEYGKAEGAFVYAFPDAKGRRVGEVAMATYLASQKALESMDGHYIDGYALEVSYKPAIPVPQTYNIPRPEPNVEQNPMAMHVPPPPRPLWNMPPGLNPLIGPLLASPTTIGPPPPAPSSLHLWAYPSPPIVDVPPRPPITQPLPSTPAPEPSPPPPYSALPLIQETQSHETLAPRIDVPLDAIPPKAPSDPCNLFVKNLDDEVVSTQRDLEKLFCEFGTITSAFLASYTPKDSSTPPVSKGFGFVAFSRAQEAELAKDKLHGTMVGRKKIFVSYAEKKEDRQMRLKALFANIERLQEEMKVEMAIKAEMRSPEAKKEARDNTISRRSVLCGQQDNGMIGEPGPSLIRATPRSFPGRPGQLRIESPSRTTFQGQQSRIALRGSPGFRKNRSNRRKERYSPKKPQSKEYEQYFEGLDLHEDFPPLPKSIKPSQSPALQKITQVSTTVKENTIPTAVDPEPSMHLEPTVTISRPQSSGSTQGSLYLSQSRVGTDADVEMSSYRSSAQGTPAIPRAPPPSSAEISTAGNTAPSTPTVSYARPRITPQSLHDRLLHANAKLATLQEGRPLGITLSTPVSPLIVPIGEIRRMIIDVENEENMDTLDTTIGASVMQMSIDSTVNERWPGTSLVQI